MLELGIYPTVEVQPQKKLDKMLNSCVFVIDSAIVSETKLNKNRFETIILQ